MSKLKPFLMGMLAPFGFAPWCVLPPSRGPYRPDPSKYAPERDAENLQNDWKVIGSYFKITTNDERESSCEQ